MRYLVFVIFVIIIPTSLFANHYVFVVDENSNPIQGYRILETYRDDIYITKIQPIKKWITLQRSRLIVIKNGYVYPVKDLIIIDKLKGVALLLIDGSQKDSLYFNPTEFLIDKDIKLLIENKKKILSKTKELFPSEVKKIEIKHENTRLVDYFKIAEQYEKTAQWNKALSIYKELLNHEPKNKKIITKIGLIYYNIGDFKKAKEYFKMLPKDEEQTVIKLVGVLIIEKNFDEALQIINNSGLNTPYLNYLKGIIYYLTNRKDEAYKQVSLLLYIDKNLAQNLRDLLR